MKKQFKQSIALSLAALLATTSFPMAQVPGKENDLQGSLRDLVYQGTQEQVQSKFSKDLTALKLGANEDVRIIVELSEAPVAQLATKANLAVDELSVTQRTTFEKRIDREQEVVIDKLEPQIDNLEVHEQFNTVFNGFSTTVPYGEIDKVAALPNVRHVYLANKYETPEPQMTKSPALTNAAFVNQALQYDGEGLVVAIIDSGIDVYHQDMKLDEGTKTKLTKEGVGKIVSDKKLKGKFYTDKVPYGYNYIDKNDKLKDLNAHTHMHGMHVAGTVAANGVIKGVAPNAQLLALKVFSNDDDNAGTFGDVVIAAVDDATALGADVMNLSLGGSAAFLNDEDPEQKAMNTAVENGILMSVSAGNSHTFGTPLQPFASNPDVGVVGAPGLATDTLAIASVDNANFMFTHNILLEGMQTPISGYGLDAWPQKNGNMPFEIVALGGTKLGGPDGADYEGIDVTGKVVLISRGLYNFNDKVDVAKAHGALGVIVYNHDGPFIKELGNFSLPFMKISKADGLAIEEALANSSGPIPFSVNEVPNTRSLHPQSGQLSAFSSWGATPDLGFKPDIAAPGGNIYSTFNDNSYGFMSGTSMAAPHASGGAALVLQYMNSAEAKQGDIFKGLNLYTSPKERIQLAKALMMNSARPVIESNWYAEPRTTQYASPRGQGAGAMDLKNAIESGVVVVAKGTKEAKVNAKEVTDTFSFELEATNYSDTAKDFHLETAIQTVQVVPVTADGETIYKQTPKADSLINTSAKISINGNPVEVISIPKRSSVTLKVDVDTTNARLQKSDLLFKDAYPNGGFVEGFVFLKQVDYSMDEELIALGKDYNAKVVTMLQNRKNYEGALEALPTFEQKMLSADTELKRVEAEVKLNNEQNASLLDMNATLFELEEKLGKAQAKYDELIAKNPALLKADAEIKIINENISLETAKNTKLVADVNALAQVIKNQEMVHQELLSNRILKEQALAEAERALALGTNLSEAEKEKLVKAIEAAKAELAIAVEAQRKAKEDYLGSQANMVTLEKNLADSNLVIEKLEAARDQLNQQVGTLDGAKSALISAQTQYDTVLKALPLQIQEQIKVYITKAAALEVQHLAVKAIAIKASAEYNGHVGLIEKFKKLLVESEQAFMQSLQAVEALEAQKFNAHPISVPFMGFKGEWSKAPAFDRYFFDANSFYHETGLLSFNPIDSSFYFLGETKALATPELNLASVGFSPNNDGNFDTVFPVVSFLRNLYDVKFYITDAKGNKLRVLGASEQERKDFFDHNPAGKSSLFAQFAWDGKIKGQMAADAQYNYVIEGRLAGMDNNASQSGPVQSLKMPVKLDTTAPVIDSCVYSKVDRKITVKATDGAGSGIRNYDVVDISGKKPTLILSSTSGNIDLSKLEKRPFSVVVFAVDYAGNRDLVGSHNPATDMFEPQVFEIGDTTAPLVKFSIATFAVFGTRTVPFAGEINDSSPIRVTVDGEVIPTQYDAAKKTFVFSGVKNYSSDGKKEIVVDVTDRAGNTRQFLKSFFIDTMAPTLEINATSELNAPLQLPAASNERLVVSSDTKLVNLKATVGDNFPFLSAYVDESLVYNEETDIWNFEGNLKPLSHSFDTQFELKAGQNNTLFAVTDVNGTRTEKGVTIWKLADGKVLNDAIKRIQFAKDTLKVQVGTETNLSLVGTKVDAKTADLSDKATFAVKGDALIVTSGKFKAVKEGVATVTASFEGMTTTLSVTVVKAESGNVPLVVPSTQDTSAGAVPTVPTVPAVPTVPNKPATPTPVKTGAEAKPVVEPLGAVTCEKPFVNGYKNGTFNAEGKVSRAEFAKMIAVILGLPVDSTKNGSGDISNHWSESYVVALIQANIMTGYSATSFKPDQDITRAEIAQVLSNIWKFKQVVVEAGEVPFKDIKGHALQNAIAQVFATKVVNGYSDNTFRPDQTASRAEAVKMLSVFTARPVKATGNQHFTDIKGHWAAQFIEAAAAATGTK